VDRLSRAYTALIAHQQLTVGFALLAVVLAVGLGCPHAIAPGHGKTVMAAYLVGARGWPARRRRSG
jgi:ABC-type nickel/cobalt efflux system permease component RcnA